MSSKDVALKLAEKIKDKDTKTLVNHSLTSKDRQTQVLAFHALYGVPIFSTYDKDISHMSDERIALRVGLIAEELKELLKDGFGVDTKIEFGAHGENVLSAIKASNTRNITEVADALGDLSYVIDGFAIEAGINLDDVLGEIHASNMTKIGEDGSPIYRSDNKVLKGPYFVEPNIEQVLFRK